MKFDLFMAIYAVESEKFVKNKLFNKYLTEHYRDGILGKVINEIYKWKPNEVREGKIKVTEWVFKDLSSKMDKLLLMELGENDKTYFVKLLEKYLEEMLKRLQQVENVPEHKMFLNLLNKIKEKYTSTRLNDVYQKSEERLGHQLQIEYKEEKIDESEKIEIKALSKLKKADIDYILTTQHKYRKESIKKLIKYLLKKERIGTLIENGVDALEILKCRVEEYLDGNTEEIILDYTEKSMILARKKEELIPIFENVKDEYDVKQLENWYAVIEKTKEKNKEKEIEIKQFDILLKEVNKKMKNVNNFADLVYNPTINAMGDASKDIEEKKEKNFYLFVENEEYLELEEEKRLMQRDERFILSKRRTQQGILLETGKTIEELQKILKEKIKNEGFGTIDKDAMEELVEKLNSLYENYEENKYSSRRKQWYMSGKPWKMMEVVVDYIDKKAKHHDIASASYRSEIAEIIALIIDTEEEMVNLFKEFQEIYGIVLDTEEKIKTFAIRKDENTKYWFMKNFAEGFVQSIEKLYGESKTEKEIKIIVNKYLGYY